MPSAGYLYNAISHAVLSAPHSHTSAYPSTTTSILVVSSNTDDMPVKVYPKRISSDGDMYVIRFSDEVVPGKKTAAKKQYALTVSSDASMLIKHEYSPSLASLQQFELRPSGKYSGYFQIVHNDRCAAPSRHRHLVLTSCTSDEEKDGIMPHKQLFRVESDDVQPTFYVKKGLSSQYFDRTPAYTRSYPDLLAGEAILLGRDTYRQLQCKRCAEERVHMRS